MGRVELEMGNAEVSPERRAPQDGRCQEEGELMCETKTEEPGPEDVGTGRGVLLHRRRFPALLRGRWWKNSQELWLLSRHSDVKRPGQSCSFPGLPAKPQTGSFSYRCLPLPSLEAGNPRSEQGWSSPGCSPGHADGHLLPASSQGHPSVSVSRPPLLTGTPSPVG